MFLRRRVSSSRINNRLRLNSKRLWLQPLESREVPATFTVTNTSDATVLAGGDLPGSLRQAIFDANANPGADTIVFSGVSGTLNMSPGTGNFVINGAVTIIGPGANNFTIDAGKLSRHFYISDDTDAQISVSISGMTLTNGAAQAPASPGSPPYESGAGGSIYVRNDILTLDGMHITGNSAALNYSGGAIAMGAGGVPSQFNTGFGSSLTITNSQLDYNVSNSAGGGGNGGGAIYFAFPNNNNVAAVGNFFSISNSTVSNNTAGNRGGGIYFSGNAGGQLGSSFSMRNTTVSGNRSLNGFAGGVLISSTTGLPMSIVNSTIANNVALNTPGGGGLALNTGTGTMNIENSIIADNTGPAASPNFYTNSAGTINSRNNIFGSLTGIDPTTVFNNQGTVIGSALLAPLANNGGPTLTQMPAYNSPAISPAGAVAVTTLTVAATSNFTAADNSLTVASNAGLTVGSFIRIDSEVMQVTGLVGLTGVTVTRGQGGTSQATHAAGQAVNNNGLVAIATITAAASIGATTVTVDSATKVVAGSFIGLESEIVQVASISGTTVTFTTPLAQAHIIGAAVSLAQPVQTTVSQPAAVGAGDTTIGVASPLGVTPGSSLLIDSEIVKVTQVSSTALTNVITALTTSTTSATVVSAASLTNGAFVQIDAEIVQVTAITNIATTLSAAITSATATTVSVTSATGIATNMFLLIDSEYVLVNAVAGNNLSVTRGQFGSTAATHLSGAAVTASVVTLSRGLQGTAASAHNSGASLARNVLTVDRAQNSTVAASHNVGQAFMFAYDQRGVGFPRRLGGYSDIGAVEVNPTAPAAVATVSNITVSGAATGTFTVTYSSAIGIDVATVNGNNTAIRVTGPGGFDVPATFVSIDNNTNGSPRTATYTFAAPTGTWDYLDNGTYQINIQANKVFDTAATAISATTVGQFNAAIGRSLVVTDASNFGPNTLRDAVEQANANAFAVDTITFDTVTMGSSSIFLASVIDITDPIFINGPGVTVDGGSSTRLFRANGPGNMAVTLQGLALNNGTVPFIITDPNIGSAVLSFDENVTLINCTLTGNTAGAVANYSIITGGAFNVQGSTFSKNEGPGVIMGSFPGLTDFSATNSTFDSNKGPAITGRVSSFNMSGSTVSNNSNSGRGGGISIAGTFNSLGASIINSTITGNTAATGGGGIYMYWSNTSGRVLIANTTIANNVALAGFQNEQGGGLLNKAKSNYLLDLENTVIAGNSNSTVPDFSSASTAIANNSFIGVYQSLNGKVVGLNNKLGSKAAPLDAFLGPLASNGGPTQTMLPYAGSPLIDASVVAPTLGTVTFPLNATATSIIVSSQASLANFVANTFIQIDSEIMRVTGAAMGLLTTITTALPAGATTANVADPTVLAPGMNLTIESEVVQVTALNSVALTTLSAAITSTTATSCTVVSATGITVGMTILIDSEYIRVSGVTGTTLTIQRGRNGSTAATHASGAGVSTPTATILRGQQGTTDAAHAINLALNAPTVSVGSFIAGSFRGQLGTTAVAHTTGSVVTIGYTQPANDQRGAGFPRAVNGKVDIGAIEVDPNIPSAVLTAALPVINTAGQTPYLISVTFADNVAMNASTIFNNNNAIRVTGPNGFNSLATFVSIDNNTNGTPRVATFSIDAPGGSWDVSENGYYTVSIEPNQVADTSGNFVEAHTLGQFQVAFTLSLIVTNDSDAGPGSLRDAIDRANANAGITDTITFDPTFFSTPRTITLFGGELLVADAVNITGPGAKFATLEGFDSRIFTIDTAGVQQPVTISGLTMTKGNAKTILTTGVTDGGGAILNLDEALTINGCVITANSATQSTTSYGGGILLGNALATLTLQNSTVSNNTANAEGGGIAIRYGCLVTIDGTTISGNTAGFSPGSTAGGGGISAALGVSSGTTPTPTVTLNNSIVSNNVAPTGGGVRVANGVSNSRPAFFSATNTTFYGNVASGSSTSSGNGGALVLGTSVNLMIQNCTITGNYAKGQGGGVFLPSFNANYGINGGFINTIIAGNIAKTTPDVGGSNGTTTTFTLPFVNSFVGAVDLTVTKINNIGGQFGTIAAPLNAMLAPVATTNGGPTNTVMPLPGSPVINAGTANPSVIMTFVGATSVTLGATTIALTTSNPMQVGSYIQIDSEIMQVTAISSPNITVTRGALSTTIATHNAGATVLRANVPPPTTDDQRGAGFPRQIGTIDIGAVEVNTDVPVATGSFAKVTAPTVGSQTISVTYTDDVAMNFASILNNSKAVRITGPNGFNTLATYVSATPGTGAKSETVVYSFTPPGGGWDNGDDGFYAVSIEPNQVSDGTNFVAAATVNNLQIAIPRTFVVDTIDDTDDGNYTVNNLSIREAIKLANQNVGVSDNITFSPTVFSSPVTIVLFSGDLQITDPVNVTGPGASKVTVDGGLNGRIMNISLGAGYWGNTVSISGMTFANGRNFPALAGAAAGITVESATLVLDAVEIYGMTANGAGGAIALNNQWAGLTLKNSYLHHNTAFQGAGVYVGNNGAALTTVPNTVQVVIQNTIFDSNTSQTSATSNGGSGAGVYTLGGSSITIDGSTFNNNTVGTSGGAIFVNGASSFAMQNSTVSNNAAVALSASGFTGNGLGGGLYFGSASTATLTSNTITANFAGSPDIAFPSSGGNGGGINAAGGANLTINGGSLTNNSGNATSTTGGGGGLFLAGSATVSINNATIAGNTAKTLGGGIMVSSMTTAATASGTLYITGSTISGNTTTGSAANTGGGGLFVSGTGGMVLVTNSTISGNSTGLNGAGILAGGSTAWSGNLTVRNSTIASNTAAGFGGGINFNSTSATATITLTLNSTVVSDNSAAGTGPDLFTNSVRANINTISSLVGSNAGGFGTGTVTGAPIIGGANLGALASNGGPTQTHALNVGSTAINAGSANTNVLATVNGAVGAATTTTTITVNSATQLGVGQRIVIDSEVMTVASVISATSITVNRAQEGTTAATHSVGANISFVAALPATDQRGVGFSRNSGGSVDIGAFEVQSAAAKITGVQINDGSAQRSRVLSLKVSFDQAVTLPVNPANAFTLTRVSDNAVVGLSAVQAGNDVILTFTPGSAVEFSSLADGRYTLTVLAAQVNGGNFDGDGNGTAGDNYVLNSTPYVDNLTPATGIFRLFGDGTGNGKVESDDFLQFRLAFLSSNVAFDYDGSGQVDSNDFLQFRLNFLDQIV